MTQKNRVLVLAMLGGSDVQLKDGEQTLKVGADDNYRYIERLNEVAPGTSYSARCEGILGRVADPEVVNQLSFPLLDPIITPLLQEDREVTIALIQTRQDPSHHMDTWGAAKLIRNVTSIRHGMAHREDRLRWLDPDRTPELLVQGNPADYDLAAKQIRAIATALTKLDGIDCIVVAPTGGTPAFSTMMTAVLPDADIGVPIRFEYLPRGANSPATMYTPATLRYRRIGDEVLRHVGRADFRLAATVARGFPYKQQQDDMLAVLKGHAAILEADYKEAAESFTLADRPDGVPTGVCEGWEAWANDLESARTLAANGDATPDVQARLVEMALLRARAFLADNNFPLALLATDAACEQLSRLAITTKSGRLPSSWMAERREDQPLRGFLSKTLGKYAPEVAAWLNDLPTALRRERNELYLVHGHGSSGSSKLIDQTLQSADTQFQDLTSRKVPPLESWLQPVAEYVQACINEVDQAT